MSLRLNLILCAILLIGPALAAENDTSKIANKIPPLQTQSRADDRIVAQSDMQQTSENYGDSMNDQEDLANKQKTDSARANLEIAKQASNSNNNADAETYSNRAIRMDPNLNEEWVRFLSSKNDCNKNDLKNGQIDTNSPSLNQAQKRK
jgi:hypothetical protein